MRPFMRCWLLLMLITLALGTAAARALADIPPLPPPPPLPGGLGGGGGSGGGGSGGGGDTTGGGGGGDTTGGGLAPGPAGGVAPTGPGLATGASSPADAPGGGPTLYVDENSIGGACNDSRPPNQVSLSTPWCSLGHAAVAAPSGSAVLIRAGNYPYLDIAHQRSWGSFTTFAPYGSPPEAVSIAGVRTVDSQFIRFSGLHFTDRVNIYLNSQHVQVLDNEITGQGIDVFDASSDVLIQRNWIHGVTRNCSLNNPDGFGMYLSGGSGQIRDITVRGNTVQGTPQDALNMGAAWNVLVVGNDISTGTPQCGDH